MTVSAFARKLGTTNPGSPAVPAPKAVTLEPHHFVSTWSLRPTESVTIGLKLPSDRDFEGAGIEARRQVEGSSVAEADRPEAIERAYLRTIVARAVCDPNNVNAPHPTLPLPDDQIARAFPPLTIRWLFDELDRLHVDQSPAYGEADETEITKLVEILCLDDPFQGIDPAVAARIRRYLALALTEFES